MRKVLIALALLAAPAFAQTRISDMTEIDKTTIVDSSKILAPGADIQSAVPGSSYSFGLDDVQYVVSSEVVTMTAHGLAAEVGKPLFEDAVYDDTVAAETPTWILSQSIDANTVRLAPAGAVVDIAVGLLEDGASYSIAANGRLLYWDESFPRYQSTAPTGTTASPMLHLLSVGGTTFRAVFVGQQTGMVDLTWDAANSEVESSAGSAAVLTVVDSTNPGLMSSADFDKLASINPAASDPGFDVATEWCAADGVTDDTTDLQTAIDNSNRELYLPEGTYLIKGQINVPTWKQIRGAGRRTLLKADAATMSGGQTLLRVADGSNYVSLNNFAIGGESAGQNFTAIDTGSATRFSLSDVWISFAGTGFDCEAWIADIRNLHIVSSDLGFKADQLNMARAHVAIENCDQWFDIDRCNGTQFTLSGEGGSAAEGFQLTTSTVDNCEGVSFDGSWFEYDSGGTNSNPEVPMITIGGTTLCGGLSWDGISLASGSSSSRNCEIAILLDRCINSTFSGHTNSGSYGVTLSYGTQVENIKNNLEESAGVGGDQYRAGSPVAETDLPTVNLFADPFFDRALPQRLEVVGTNATIAEETTTTLPGKVRSFKVTASAASQNSASFFMDFDLTDPVEPLYYHKGRRVSIGIWIYAPSAHYDLGTAANRYPYLSAQVFGGAGGTVNGSTASRTFHIPDEWALHVIEIDIPSDGDELRIRPYLSNSGVDQTLSGQHIFVGGIVVVPGGVERLIDLREGKFSTEPKLDTALEITIRGSGTDTVDAASWADAATQLNATTVGGVIWIEGTVKLDAAVNFTSPVSICGRVGTDPTIEYQDDTGYLVWNNAYDGIADVKAGQTIAATSAFASEVVVPEGNIAAGDWFLVSSEDAITGITYSGSSGSKPLEIHQCKEVRTNGGGNDYIVFDDFIVDALTTSPKAVKIDEMIEGIVVSDLAFTWVGSTAPEGPGLLFKACSNVDVHNVHFKTTSPNEIQFQYCGNCKVHDIVLETKEDWADADGYGVICAAVNGMTFCDSIAYGNRHVFTTTAPISSGYRYGTPRNVTIDNVIAKQNGTTGSTLVPFDTHEGGWGIVFQDCHVSIPYEARSYNPTGTLNSNRAFQSRARATVFKGCTIDAAGTNSGFLILAADNRVEDCSMNGGWIGVTVQYDESGGTTNGVDRCVVSNFKMINADDTSRMVFISAGDDHLVTHSTIIGGGTGGYRGVDILDDGDDAPTVQIDHCTFRNLQAPGVDVRATGCDVTVNHCVFDDVASNGSFNRGCIHLEGTSTATVRNCSMAKVNNKFSISGTSFGTSELTMTACDLTGYTGVSGDEEDTGFDTTNTNSTALDTAADPINWVSP